MSNKFIRIILSFVAAIGAVLVILWLVGYIGSGNSTPALAAPYSLTVTVVNPSAAPNDLDTHIMITGTGFTAVPTVTLGSTLLEDIGLASVEQLTATVPWGMDPGIYTLTVVNPDGEAASLPDAFTVTQGIGEWSTGGPYGGWIFSLALGDSQGEIVYATLGNVGLFRSRDGGANWELIFIENGWLNELEIDITNTDRLYIAKQAHGKTGLYRSEDGGDTWSAMPQPIPGINTRVFLAFVNPHNGKLFGALRADTDDSSCDFGCGLFRFDRTKQTWIRLEQSGLLDEDTGVTAVGFDAQDSNTMYAGLVGGLVIKSIDGGQTWSSLSQTPLSYIHKLVVNPVSGEPWVCSTGGELPGGLYRYDGDKWVSMYISSRTFTEVTSLVFDPNAADVDTQLVWIAAIFDGALKSEDGGQNWSPISPMRSEAIALNPSHPQTIYSGNNESVAKTSDGGANWHTINEGLTGIIPKNMGVSPHDPAVVYGVADSIGIFGSSSGGETWQRLTTSTGGPIVVDPVHPQRVVNADYDRFLIADDGWNFDREIPIPRPPGMTSEDYLVVPKAMIARSGMWVLGVGYLDRRLPYWNFEGGGGIYLSADGDNWSRVGPIQTCPVTGLGFDPADMNIFYASTSFHFGSVTCEGTFLRSTDSGQTWQESTTGLPSDIGDFLAVEPVPPYRIYLASGGGLYMSSDQGITWNEITGPSNSYTTSLLFLPGSPSILYAGTGEGLFRSMDGAQTWQRAPGTLGRLEIWSMAGTAAEDRHILYVATVGGLAESGQMQTQIRAKKGETLINAGVYRTTMLPLGYLLYLPMNLR